MLLQEHQQEIGTAPYWLILTLAYHFPLFIDFCFNLRAVVTYKSHGFWCRFGLCQAGILNVFRLRQGPCPGPVPSMSRSCLTHVTVMVQSGCSRFLLLQWWFPVTMLSCLIMIRNPAVMPWSRAGDVLVVCRHAHDSYVAVLSCSCHVILNIYSSPSGNFLAEWCAQCAHSVPGLHGPNLHPENDRVSDRTNESMFQ